MKLSEKYIKIPAKSMKFPVNVPMVFHVFVHVSADELHGCDPYISGRRPAIPMAQRITHHRPPCQAGWAGKCLDNMGDFTNKQMEYCGIMTDL